MALRMGGKPTQHTHVVNLKNYGDEIRIVPFSDVHWGSKLCAADKFLEAMERAGDHPNVLFIGGGDYLDFSKAGDRAIMSNCAESTRNFMDEIAQQRMEEFYAAVAPIIKGRCIGLLEGNHHWEFSGARDTCTQRLAMKLGVPYLECMSSVLIRIKVQGSAAAYPIFIAHRTGAGGGYTAGAAFNALQRVALWFRNARAYISGDDHRLGHIEIAGISVDAQGDWDEENIHLIKMGGWQLAYVPGVPNYLVEKAAAPMALGLPYLNLRVERKRKDGVRKLKVVARVST